jgi:hypothetical protein
LEDLIELDTDECGHVTTQDDLIQIKLWINYGEVKFLVGTISFRYKDRNFSYSGILCKNNSDDLFNTWNYTKVSNFVLRRNENDLFFDIDYWFYHDNFPEQYRDYRNFINEFPKYSYMKINN